MKIKNWTNEQIDFVRKHFAGNRTKWCAKRLGKTERRVAYVASKLNITKTHKITHIEYNKLTMKEIKNITLPTHKRKRLQFLMSSGLDYEQAFKQAKEYEK